LELNFDKAQKKAVYADDQPLLVLAGPGSGKTTVLVHRIRYMTEQLLTDPSQILVLTFTRASAGEMKQRYLKLTGKSETKVTFGTFHSVFYLFLRRHGCCPDQVISGKDELKLTKAAIADVLGSCMVSDKTAQMVLDSIGRIKNGMPVDEELPVRVYPLLQEKMRRLGVIDFDDMLLFLYRLLTSQPEVVLELRERFKYILIDEFQDINRTQYEIIKILSHPSDHVFAVGDDDQSIYGFRGSDPSYMKEFLKDFKTGRKVILTANYRSTGKIVQSSKRLIGHNRNRFEKHLVSAGEKGTAPVFRSFETPCDQMDYVDKKIRFYLDQSIEAKPFSIAVLARTAQELREAENLLSPEVKDHISLMTFHASKGLEFDVVFIISANEGITPDRRSMNSNDLEEERRCFYVAVTRCRKHLHILNTKKRYTKQVERSRFVTEMKLLWI